MKTIFIWLTGVISFTCGSIAGADLLGDEDDTYVGFQVTIPLAEFRSNITSGKHEYSVMLVSQQDGMRDGIVFTRDTDGNRTLGYLKPSRNYRIGQSRVEDYTLPIVKLSSGNNVQSNPGFVEGVVYVAAGIAAVSFLLDKLLEETSDCADPDKESDNIAGC